MQGIDRADRAFIDSAFVDSAFVDRTVLVRSGLDTHPRDPSRGGGARLRLDHDLSPSRP